MPGTPPLISVFTGLYDTGPRLRRTYESVLAQSYGGWEWVLVDDSTTDETAELVLQLIDDPRADGRVRLLRQSPAPHSIGATKATAAGAAFGDVLVELDHDDELRPEALEIIAATFVAHPEVDALYSDWVDWIDTDGGGTSGTFPAGWGFGFGAHASEMLEGRRVIVQLAPPLTWETIRHIVAAPNHVRAWRRDFYHRAGGHDPTLGVADDYDLVVRSFLTGHFTRVPRPLYLQHHDPAGSNASRRRNDEIQRQVVTIAEAQRAAIDRRCIELAVPPSPQDPLCTAEPTTFANSTIDVMSEASADGGLPLVSVVTATYRRPDLLRAAIDSVLGQDYPNLELLVIGDACPDVDAVIRDVTDPRVRHANLAARRDDGGAAPRNFALRTMCRSDLVAYLDDDNTWEPDHLSSLLDALAAVPGAQYAFSSFYLGDEPISCRQPRRFQIDTSALLHRRSLLERFGYWRSAASTGGAHDWELVARWADEPWAVTGRPTLRYRLDPRRHGPELIRAVRDVAAEVDRNTSTHTTSP